MPSLTDRTCSLLTLLADKVLRLLGQGTFGKVVEAIDNKKKTKCAVKIIRSVQKYRDASRIELRVLATLSMNDKNNRNKCIHLRDSFDFRNHICIVTDLLGQSVFDFLKGNGFVPFPSSQIQNFARQLFTSVACEYSSAISLIGTDCSSSSRPQSRPHRPETREHLACQWPISDFHIQQDHTIVIAHYEPNSSTTQGPSRQRDQVDRFRLSNV